MRLSEITKSGIIQALSEFIDMQQAELYLYGSRVNDELKGGDIDLLLVFENDTDVTAMLLQKHYILAKIKQFIGEQKIDLAIATRAAIATDNFLSAIFPEAILLYSWNKK